MKRIFGIVCLALAVLTAGAKKVKEQPQQWPDGTVIDSWFQQTQKVDVSTLGKQYVLTDYGVMAGWPRVQTKEIQTVIDRCAQEGGGVIVVPTGTFLSGALFFRQGTHLHLQEGAVLKGSDRIIDYPLQQTRFEGRRASSSRRSSMPTGWMDSPSAERVPLMATDCSTGKSSGFVEAGIRNVPTRMPSAPD